MERIDELLSGLAGGASLPVVLLVALLLGLRHATDPDHLAAIAPLATEPDGRRRAERVGLAWGAGHGTALLLLGIPLVLLRATVPDGVGTGLERAVGAAIVLLAVAALVRWWRARRAAAAGAGGPAAARTPRSAFALGLLHGTAGTGGATVLLLGLLPSPGAAAAALLVFAPATALSMTVLTGLWAHAIGTVPALIARWATPVVASLSLVFGVWYLGG